MKRRCIAMLMGAAVLATMISPASLALEYEAAIAAEVQATVTATAEPEEEAVLAATVDPQLDAQPVATAGLLPATAVPTEVPATATPQPTETPAPKEPLAVTLTMQQRYAHVGEQAIQAELRVSGGDGQYNVVYQVLCGGELLLETDPLPVVEQSAKFQYAPPAHGTYTVNALVQDGAGETLMATVEIPVAADDDSGDAWIAKAAQVSLTGDWSADLLAVAESQLGYAESEIQFIIDENGKKQGTTIYGDWFSYDHMEWCAAFVAWCANRAGIPAEHFPTRSRSSEWLDKLAALGAYEPQSSGYQPQPGDLIFINRDGGEEPHHMGVVAAADRDGVFTIEGNVEKAVRRIEYAPNDGVIVGYGNVQALMQLAAQPDDGADGSDEPTQEEAVPEVPYYCGLTEHVHGETCPTDCAETEHVHDEACQEPEITYYCGLTEHVHGETCPADCAETEHTHNDACRVPAESPEYSCGIAAHSHDDLCWDADGNLICERPEHQHENCLTPEEQVEVDAVEALIAALPVLDAYQTALTDEATDADAYRAEIGQQAYEAYLQYSLLSEKQQSHVENAAQLLALEELWSAYATGGTAASPIARDDDKSTVGNGNGIRFRLFNYDADVNKNGVANYFNFRGKNFHDPEGDDVTINESVDADGYVANRAQVEPLLQGGYPVFDGRGVTGDFSLGYLFGAGGRGVKGYSPNNTLLRYNASANRYYYDSADNAVDYDTSTDRFIVRNYAERGDSTAGFSGNYADFMPFTYWDGTTRYTNDAGKEYFYDSDVEMDYWFGMTMDTEFFQPKGGRVNNANMVFEFSGDDDVWVFIDDVLVLDLGGTHGVTSGSINFATGVVEQHLNWAGSSTPSYPTTIRACFEKAGVEPNGGWNADGTTFADYSEHTMKFFYLERGSGSANCKISFNLPTLPEKSLTVTKDLVADENSPVKDYIADSLAYQFRVVRADAPEQLYIQPGTGFDVYENSVKTGSGTVDGDGYFYLKAGQSAQFDKMLEKGGGATAYIVQEVMPDGLTGQYAGVEYTVSNTTGEIQPGEGPVSEFTAFATDGLSAEESHLVIFRNRVDTTQLGALQISKRQADGAEFPAGQTFRMQVSLGGELLPVGTQYTVGGQTRTVESAGAIELGIGETAKIAQGILSGTEYEIVELGTAEGGFNASYSGTVTAGGQITDASYGASSAVGAFPLNGTVHVIVTNANYDFAGEIPISKLCIDNAQTATFRFSVEQVVQAQDGGWTVQESLPGIGITVADDSLHTGKIVIGYDNAAAGTYYYRVSEQPGTDDFIYDDTFYIVEMTVANGTAAIANVWKNGAEAVEISEIGLPFVNRKTTRLLISKTVEGLSTDEAFAFTAAVTDANGEPFLLPEGDGYAVEGNMVTFALKHGETVTISGIPLNASVTVTETAHDGYAVWHTSGSLPERIAGDSVIVQFGTGMESVHFINAGSVELPFTGGPGKYWYTMGGLLLISAAALLLYRKARSKKG